MRLDPQYKKDRAFDVLNMRSKGFTLREIGIKYDVTAETIRMIEARALRAIRKLEEDERAQSE